MKNMIRTIILIFILYGLFIHSAYARRIHGAFDFSRMPENIQQFKEALLKIEEQMPRMRFEQEILDDADGLNFILKEM